MVSWYAIKYIKNSANTDLIYSHTTFFWENGTPALCMVLRNVIFRFFIFLNFDTIGITIFSKQMCIQMSINQFYFKRIKSCFVLSLFFPFDFIVTRIRFSDSNSLINSIQIGNSMNVKKLFTFASVILCL